MEKVRIRYNAQPSAIISGFILAGIGGAGSLFVEFVLMPLFHEIHYEWDETHTLKAMLSIGFFCVFYVFVLISNRFNRSCGLILHSHFIEFSPVLPNLDAGFSIAYEEVDRLEIRKNKLRVFPKLGYGHTKEYYKIARLKKPIEEVRSLIEQRIEQAKDR
jgi:hypothetical protein